MRKNAPTKSASSGKIAPLTPKQRLFIAEYLKDLNALQAAIRAGYSEKTAGVIGHQNLNKLQIKAEIQKAMAKRGIRVEVTADNVLKELALIAFANQEDYYVINEDGSMMVKPFEDMPEGASRAISGVEEVQRIMGGGERSKDIVLEQRRKLRHHDKVKALELLGKHLGMFIERSMDVPFEAETFELPALKAPGSNGNGNGGNGNGGHHD